MIVKINVPYVGVLKPKGASGNPTKYDGKPVWTNSNPAGADLVVSEDGLTAQVTFLLADSAGQISAVGDGKQGEGEAPVVSIFDWTTLPEDVVSATLEFTEVAPPAPVV